VVQNFFSVTDSIDVLQSTTTACNHTITAHFFLFKSRIEKLPVVDMLTKELIREWPAVSIVKTWLMSVDLFFSGRET